MDNVSEGLPKAVPQHEADERAANTITPDAVQSVDRGIFSTFGKFIHGLSHKEQPSEQDGDLSNPVLRAKVTDLDKRLNESAFNSIPPQPQERDE